MIMGRCGRDRAVARDWRLVVDGWCGMVEFLCWHCVLHAMTRNCWLGELRSSLLTSESSSRPLLLASRLRFQK